MHTQNQGLIQIRLACLLPTKFDVKLTCQEDSFEIKWSVAAARRVEESVRRQLDAACKTWAHETGGKVLVRVKHDDLVVTDRLIQVIKECRVKEPSMAELMGVDLYRSATCFMVWVPFPVCVFKGLGKPRPYTPKRSDCMWIPTTESRELHDLKHKVPRDAARHELKEWVKSRMEEIGVDTIPSPDERKKKEYWPKLREALSDANNISKLNETISARMAKRA